MSGMVSASSVAARPETEPFRRRTREGRELMRNSPSSEPCSALHRAGCAARGDGKILRLAEHLGNRHDTFPGYLNFIEHGIARTAEAGRTLVGIPRTVAVGILERFAVIASAVAVDVVPVFRLTNIVKRRIGCAREIEVRIRRDLVNQVGHSRIQFGLV